MKTLEGEIIYIIKDYPHEKSALLLKAVTSIHQKNL